MRSSDVILGIAYDVPAFTLFQEILANELGVGLGTYTHVSNSLHIYEKHFEMAEKMLQHDNVEQSLSWARNTPNQHEGTGFGFPQLRKKIIEPMMRAEDALWEADDLAMIISVYNSFSTASIANTMWEDVLGLLTIRRLRVGGYLRESREMLENLNYRGYDFFKRKE